MDEMKIGRKERTFLIIGVLIMIIIAGLLFSGKITGFTSFTNGEEEISERFNSVVLEALYSKTFCNDGRHTDQETRMGKDCAETNYPLIKISHGEEYEGLKAIALAARVENYVKKEMPEINNQTLGFLFVDSQENPTDAFYVNQGTVTYPED